MSVEVVEDFLKENQDESEVERHSRYQWENLLERSRVSSLDDIDSILSGDYNKDILSESLTNNPHVLGQVGLADKRNGNEEPVKAAGSLVQSDSDGNPIFFVKLDEGSPAHPLYPEFKDLGQGRGVLYQAELASNDFLEKDVLTTEARQKSKIIVEGDGYKMRITDSGSKPAGIDYNTELVIREPTEEALKVYVSLSDEEY